MNGIVTLAQRRRNRLDAMAAALPAVDAALTAYGREQGGRFIRFGSTATGTFRPESDVDIIADFPDDRTAIRACTAADEICSRHGLKPDCRPACWTSERVRERAEKEGVMLP